MATIRIYKVAEVLGIPSHDIIDLLKREHGIEVKSASSTIEEIVAKQFAERTARERNLSLPTGPLFSARSATTSRGRKGAKAAKPAEPAARPRLGPPRLVKAPKIAPAGVVEEPPDETGTPPIPGATPIESGPVEVAGGTAPPADVPAPADAAVAAPPTPAEAAVQAPPTPARQRTPAARRRRRARRRHPPTRQSRHRRHPPARGTADTRRRAVQAPPTPADAAVQAPPTPADAPVATPPTPADAAVQAPPTPADAAVPAPPTPAARTGTADTRRRASPGTAGASRRETGRTGRTAGPVDAEAARRGKGSIVDATRTDANSGEAGYTCHRTPGSPPADRDTSATRLPPHRPGAVSTEHAAQRNAPAAGATLPAAGRAPRRGIPAVVPAAAPSAGRTQTPSTASRDGVYSGAAAADHSHHLASRGNERQGPRREA